MKAIPRGPVRKPKASCNECFGRGVVTWVESDTKRVVEPCACVFRAPVRQKIRVGGNHG
jgi:uncharacterized OB-fold protein